MAKKTKKKDLTPKAEAGDQMFVRGAPTKRAPKKSMRPRLRPEDVSPRAEADDQMLVKPTHGRKFSGTY